MRISGVAVISVAAALLLKEKNKNAAVAAAMCAVILIFTFSINGGASQVIKAVASLGEGTAISRYAPTLVKALGIGYVASVTESICRDAGEETVAAAVILGAKVELLLLSLPLIEGLMETVAGLM